MSSAPWREAASLLLLARRPRRVAAKPDTPTAPDYDVLLQSRRSDASSFPSSLVFPGGVTEDSDFSEAWLAHMTSFGVKQEQINLLHRGTTRPPIFEGDLSKRHIGFRITAIREAFEELGILICIPNRPRMSQNASEHNLWASAITNFEIKEWQKKVHNNAEEFLNLCRNLDCYPNIWALHYWNNWLTPPTFKSRFNTAFFVAAFNTKPHIVCEQTEVADIQWSAPDDIIAQISKAEINLLPPQKYEFHRLSRRLSLEELIVSASQGKEGYSEVYYPVIITAKDGRVVLLPGDEMYPQNVDLTKKYARVESGLTMEELRYDHTRLHRFEDNSTRSTFVSNIGL